MPQKKRYRDNTLPVTSYVPLHLAWHRTMSQVEKGSSTVCHTLIVNSLYILAVRLAYQKLPSLMTALSLICNPLDDMWRHIKHCSQSVQVKHAEKVLQPCSAISWEC